ncbi:kinesin-like protein KIF25 isoform X2 [Ursus maritimus]|uniref:Kinesin-like protein KIF25 isoform X2 n=1 Tax=Ursus maritimus TaxID=29073 RepID=A0A384BX07_URSMA|nr:kinesin-like protein KIF25 isoform X2 [Ursus maritimus]
MGAGAGSASRGSPQRTESCPPSNVHLGDGSLWCNVVNSILSVVCVLMVQTLQQDIEALRASALEVFRACREHLQDGLSEVVAAVQRAQLCHQALLAWQSKAGHLERSLQEVNTRYELEKQKRKVLHNRLVELKGNIRVHCRIRPLLPFDKELDDAASQDSSMPAGVVHAVDDETVLVKCDRPAHALINKTYNFERVYGPAESQHAVFGDVCPLLTSLLDGYNVCILAYGQTGCGKSYTMLGPHSEEECVPARGPHSDLGILPRAAGELFRLISENPSRSLKVDVSIVEVYNNDIFDLLAKERCTVVSGPKREAPTTKAAKREVSPPTRRPVHSAEDFIALAAGSLRLRAQLATQVHARSSRSHLIITATLTTAPTCSSPGVSGVTGLALRETSFINRSLAALADVLGALSERRGHIPYRNSQLTHFLQDVLGGDAKLLVILCVSPSRKHVAETLRCLGLGARVRQVQRGQAGGGSPASRRPRNQ